MHTFTEVVDILGVTGCKAEERINLLIRESIRHRRDKTLKTRLLSLLDDWLGLGYWWFSPFIYESRNPDGSLWRRHQVRRTLAGYTIACGPYVEYYDDGTKSCEGLIHYSASFGPTIYRRHKYWLQNGTAVSQVEWMRELFGPEIDGCYDPAWEK